MQSYKVLALIGCVIGLAISIQDLVKYELSPYAFYSEVLSIIIYIFALIITFAIQGKKKAGISLIVSAILVLFFGLRIDGIFGYSLLLVAGTMKLVKEEKSII